jgi:Family of unknown function (DUF5682)
MGTRIGRITRVLFDKSALSAQTSVKMRYALAPSNEPTQSAAWLEGFLYGSGLLLIHHPTLWQVVDEWVVETDMARLESLLPLLRRTFAAFSKSEKSKLFALANQEKKAVVAPSQSQNYQDEPYFYDFKRAKGVFETVWFFIESN